MFFLEFVVVVVADLSNFYGNLYNKLVLPVFMQTCSEFCFHICKYDCFYLNTYIVLLLPHLFVARVSHLSWAWDEDAVRAFERRRGVASFNLVILNVKVIEKSNRA